MVSTFNGGLLRIARQARGMSQGELSTLSGVSQGNISKAENGFVEPTDDVVGRLADALKFPTTLFFEPDRVYGLPLSVHSGPMYRKKASVGQRERDKLEAELTLQLMHLRRLLRAAEFVAELPMPKLDLADFGGDPEKVADMVRRTWLVPNGPLPNLIEYVERAGCIVVVCDFTGLDVDGVTQHAPGSPPCIFINKDQPGDRQRFTIAHELGHIIMHQVPTPDMESEANAFASALLMPARDVRPHLTGRLTIQRLAALKPVWKASMQALLYRAKTVGAITDNQSQYLWRQISAMGYRRREPPELDIAPEQPSVLPAIFKLHLEQLGYDLADICRMLHVYEEDLRRIHPLPGKPTGPFLRVVK